MLGASSAAAIHTLLAERPTIEDRHAGRSTPGSLAPTIAYSDEIIDIWFARGLTLGERRLDEGEFLDVFTATPDEVQAWCRDGSIIDCKTLVGTLWLQNVLSGAWSLDWSGTMPASVAR